MGIFLAAYCASTTVLIITECKYMKHIFELRMKDQIEERSSQLLHNLSSCEKKA